MSIELLLYAGTDRLLTGPTVSAGRVSTSRHGVVGTNTDSSPDPAPDTNWVPTTPTLTPTTAAAAVKDINRTRRD